VISEASSPSADRARSVEKEEWLNGLFGLIELAKVRATKENTIELASQCHSGAGGSRT